MAAPLPVIALFGPTAVGKTELLLSLFPGRGEVISADSMQVYRYLDIGTAKPELHILETLPHHLIDILDPDEQYNLGMFLDCADTLAGEITRRGRVPVLSGGTAYYFKHFLFGLPGTPKGDREIRRRIQEELKRKGRVSLYRRLQDLDTAAAERIGENDTYRITRALEVIEQTGKPFSSFSLPDKPRPGFNVLLLGLKRKRDELNARIDGRVDSMFRQGLPDEVKSLFSRGYSARDPGLKGIGYREFIDMIRLGCSTLEEVKTRIKLHSRQYAKRQMTFFSSLPGVVWFHPEAKEEIETYISRFLESV